MFAPKLDSPGSQRRNDAAARRDCATSASVRRLEANGAAEVRVRVAEIGGDRVDDGVGHLRAAGAVEEHRVGLQRREARANGVDVEGDRAHRP